MEKLRTGKRPEDIAYVACDDEHTCKRGRKSGLLAAAPSEGEDLNTAPLRLYRPINMAELLAEVMPEDGGK